MPHQVCQLQILHEVNKAILWAWPSNASVWQPALPNCRGAVPAQSRPSVPLGARSISSRRCLSCSGVVPVRAAGLSPSERVTLQRNVAAGRNCGACGADGGGLPVVLSAVPDGHSVVQAGVAAGSVAAFLSAAEGAQEAAGALIGESRGVLGRAAAGATFNAVERVYRLYRNMQKTVYRVRTRGRSRAGWRGAAAGAARPRPGSDHQDSALSEGSMMR